MYFFFFKEKRQESNTQVTAGALNPAKPLYSRLQSSFGRGMKPPFTLAS